VTLLKARAAAAVLAVASYPFFMWLGTVAHPNGDYIKRINLVKFTEAQEDKRSALFASLLLSCSAEAGEITIVVNDATESAPPMETA